MPVKNYKPWNELKAKDFYHNRNVKRDYLLLPTKAKFGDFFPPEWKVKLGI